MKVFNLPDDIFSTKAELDSPIIIHHYFAAPSSYREKSILHRNAISLVIKGNKTIQFAEKAVSTNDTEIHFLSSGNCISSFDIGRQENFESILIFLDDSVLTDFSVGNIALVDEVKKKYPVQSNRYVSFKKDDFIRNYIRSMQLIVAEKNPASSSMKKLKLWELLLYLLEKHGQQFIAFLNRGTQLPYETAMMKVLEENITENLNVDEMAFLCNVSTSTFKRQFKSVYNSSPASWFAEQKMKLAIQLLTQYKEKPGEIWFKLGFESHTSFAKAFKSHFGVSPKDYVRKMNQNEQLLN